MPMDDDDDDDDDDLLIYHYGNLFTYLPQSYTGIKKR
jgi:hypothetical protein